MSVNVYLAKLRAIETELKEAGDAYQKQVAANPSDREACARMRQRVNDLIEKRTALRRRGPEFAS